MLTVEYGTALQQWVTHRTSNTYGLRDELARQVPDQSYFSVIAVSRNTKFIFHQDKKAKVLLHFLIDFL